MEEKELLLKAEEIKQKINENADDLKSHFDLSVCYYYLSEFKEDEFEKNQLIKKAVKYLDKVIASDDKNINALYYISVYYIEFSKLTLTSGNNVRLLKKAYKYCEKIINLNDKYFEAFANMAIISLNLSEIEHNLSKKEELIETAYLLYKKAAEFCDNNPHIYSDLSSCILKKAKIRTKGRTQLVEEAIKYFEKAIAVNESNVLFYIWFANDLSNFAKETNSNELFDKAIELHEKAIELDKNDIQNYNDLYKTLTFYLSTFSIHNKEAEQKKNVLIKLIDVCEKISTINPNNNFYKELSESLKEQLALLV